jgi:hypothetical protein
MGNEVEGVLIATPIIEVTQSHRNICFFTLEIQTQSKTRIVDFVAFDKNALYVYRECIKGNILSVAGHKQEGKYQIFVDEVKLV